MNYTMLFIVLVFLVTTSCQKQSPNQQRQLYINSVTYENDFEELKNFFRPFNTHTSLLRGQAEQMAKHIKNKANECLANKSNNEHSNLHFVLSTGNDFYAIESYKDGSKPSNINKVFFHDIIFYRNKNFVRIIELNTRCQPDQIDCQTQQMTPLIRKWVFYPDKC